MHPQVIVIGAGLGGLMAAGACAQTGARVLLLEKNALPGRKYAYSCMGKAALSNTAPALDHFHGRDRRFVADAFAALPRQELCAWFERHGAPPADGPHYGLVIPPDPDTALAALARGLGPAEFMPQTRVCAVAARGAVFQVTLDDGRLLECSRVVLACGGPNLPQLGGEPGGLEIARLLGHQVRRPCAAHVGLRVDAAWTRALSGLWMDVQLTLRDAGGILRKTTGALLFTHAGLTGQAAFDVSALVEPSIAEGNAPHLEINFFPGQTCEEVDQWLFRTLGGQTRVRAVEALEPILPPKLAAALLAQQRVKAGARVDRLEQTQRRGLLEDMLGLRLSLSGTLGLEAAEDFAGGVSVREIDPRTFQSRRVPGLYVAGRMLDLGADWGGFRQHFALASGMLAGRHAGLSLDDSGRQG